MGKNVKVKDEKAEEEKRLKKEEADKKKKERGKKKDESSPTEEGMRGLVRICEKDIPGSKKITNALLNIKGVGPTLAQTISNISGIDQKTKIGHLSEEQVMKIEEIIKNPMKYNIPPFMLNRVRDTQTSESRHAVASELIIAHKNDIDFKKKIRCYQGVRHDQGLPVRGQRTRSSFRGKNSVGVIKKKQAPAKAGEEKK